MKAARLVSEIVLLSARSSPMTAREIARRLEVTERTIYRDLDELSRIGVPVVAASGAGGGFSLLGGWSSPLSGLTRTELESLLLGSLAATDLGLSRELATARAKILPTEVGDADVSRAVVVDGPDWFCEPEVPDALGTIVTALRTRRGLSLDYARAEGPRHRSVIPLGLAVKAGRWYLVAQRPGGSPRTYRVSRIETIALRWVRAEPPADFDLAAHWRRARRDFDRSIRTTAARLRIPAASLEDLRRAVPGPLTAEAIAAAVEGEAAARAETYEIDILVESVEIAVAQLLTVPGVEVLSPAEIRKKLARRAHELLIRNSSAAEPQSTS